MRTWVTGLVLVVSAVLSLASATQQQAAPAPTPYGQDPTGCDVACNHYLQCKGIQDDATYSQCIGSCQCLTNKKAIALQIGIRIQTRAVSGVGIQRRDLRSSVFTIFSF